MKTERLTFTKDNRLYNALSYIKESLGVMKLGTGRNNIATWKDVAGLCNVSLSGLNKYLNGGRSPSKMVEGRIYSVRDGIWEYLLRKGK